MLSLCPMGRIIAIDYGRKRTGLAVTDTLQMIANGQLCRAVNLQGFWLIMFRANPLNGL